MTEKELLEKFKSILLKKHNLSEDSLILSPGNKSKEMDFVIINEIANSAICLEAKIFNDSRSNSNSFLSLFGKIIKGRYLCENSSTIKNIKFKEYGFLFSGTNANIIKAYFSIVAFDDWQLFCESFNLKRIYIVSNSDYELFTWKEFYSWCEVNSINSYLENAHIVDEDDDVVH